MEGGSGTSCYREVKCYKNLTEDPDMVRQWLCLGQNSIPRLAQPDYLKLLLSRGTHSGTGIATGPMNSLFFVL